MLETLAKQTDNICINENLSEKMRHIKFPKIFTYKRITEIQTKKPDLGLIKKKKKLSSNGFCRSSWPQSKRERNKKPKQIPRPF